jgi:hypothetical protein
MLNEHCGRKYFAQVYSQFDHFIDFIESDPEWAQTLYKIDCAYAKSHENSLYGLPPIGYVDDTKSGKSKKKYFHFSDEYFDYIEKNCPELISESEELGQLFQSLKDISKISKMLFEEAIQSIGQSVDLSKAMYTDDGKLLTLIKVVRYDPSELAASNAHFDFSGLSFLFDNSESDDCESLLISPYKNPIAVEDFHVPFRQYKKDDSKSSLLLIPGLALQHCDVPIHPTPHAVKQQNKTRYAIIVFAMAPNIKLSYDEIKLRQIKLPSL